MTRRTLTIAILVAPLLLAGCGGGGAGDTPPTTSAETYQTRAAWVNSVSESGTRGFTISGSVNGVAVSGSGSATFGALAGSVFEGRPALSRTTVLTGSLVAGGQTLPWGSTQAFHVDANYLPLGRVADEYWLVTGTPAIPQTARVNDAGTLYTFNRYTSSSKTVLLGTGSVGYAVQPDTASTALLRVVITDRPSGGAVSATTIATFRMTPAGSLTRLTEEFQQGGSALTARY